MPVIELKRDNETERGESMAGREKERRGRGREVEKAREREENRTRVERLHTSTMCKRLKLLHRQRPVGTYVS